MPAPAAVLVAVLAAFAPLIARAGGGSGGGSSGGSSGGSYSGGGGFFFFGGGTFGLVVFLLFLGLQLYRSYNAKQSAGSSGEHLAGLPGQRLSGTSSASGEVLGAGTELHRERGALDAGLAAVKAHDPAFNQADFLSDVNRAFFTIQQAWTERKPDLSRQVMHDGIWQQHNFQIEQYVQSNRQNILENLAVQNTALVAASSDDAFDTIVARFFATCADYDIDLGREDRKVVRGDRQIRPWAEDWVFQRSSRAVTKPNAGTMAKRCPNCGAPLDLDLAGVCRYCHAPIMSGEFDWVLTRIEQLPSYEHAQQTVP